MRTYTITGPDGKDYSIDGPEGATREEVIAKVKERLGAKPPVNLEDPYTATAQKQSALENALAGAGGAVHGLILGAKQLLGKATPQELADHAAAMKGLRSTTSGKVGEFTGNVAAGAIPTILAPAAAATYAGSAAIGAGLGALQPTQEGESRLQNAGLGAVGGAAGNAIGRGISKLIQPVPRLPSASKDVGVAAAERIGMPLTAGDKTGSVGLQQVEDLLSRTPGSAGAMRRIYDLKQQAINKAAAKSIGETADDISEATFAAAKARLGDQFKQLSENAQVTIGDDFMRALGTIKTGNDQLGAFRNTNIDTLVEQGLELAKQGNLTGKAYQTLRSKISDRASDAFKSSNSELGQALKTVRDALDTSARNGMDDATKSAWDTVRRQYANLKVLEKGNVVNAGNVNPVLVKNALNSYNASASKSGQLSGELMDIKRVGENFKIPAQGSQTYERGAMANMLFGNPLTGLPLVAGSRAMQMALMNKPMQAYLTKGLTNLPPSVRNMLMLSGALGGGATGATINQQ